MSSTPTAGQLAARLTADTSGMQAAMAAAGTTGEREMKRIQRQVQFVNDYIKELATRQQAVAATAGGLGAGAQHLAKTEVSARQTAAAMRQLPAQFTDIATQLAGGQNPMLILLQQGGQIKDSFGGVGNAIRGIGAAINPVTVAIGAAVGVVAALATAAYQAHQEQRKLENSLTLTGNAAGMTVNSFRQMAADTAAASRTTVGTATETVQALLNTGQISAQAMGAAALASQNLQRLTGDSAESIAKDFARMGTDVAKWAAEHNRQYHYLTLAQYDYIKRLQEQGRTHQAEAENFRLLNEHFARTTSNLGLMEKAWKGVQEWASKGWRAMMNVGADKTSADRIAELKAEIANMTKGGEPMSGSFTSGQLDKARRQLAAVTEQFYREEEAAVAQAENAERQRKAIEKRVEQEKRAAAEAEKAARKRAADMEFEFQMWFEKFEKKEKAQQAANQREVDFQAWFREFEQRDGGGNLQVEKEQATGKWLRDAADQAKAAQRQVAGEMQLAEDSIINLARTGKLEFGNLWTFMAEEYLRNLLRMQAAKYALDSSGNFVGWGKTASNVVDALSTFFGANSHATGLDVVPYDGYPAILHRGEKVLTAADASRSSTGNVQHFDFSGQVLNVGQGVNRAEMQAALSRQAAETEGRMRRLSREGALS